MKTDWVQLQARHNSKKVLFMQWPLRISQSIGLTGGGRRHKAAVLSFVSILGFCCNNIRAELDFPYLKTEFMLRGR